MIDRETLRTLLEAEIRRDGGFFQPTVTNDGAGESNHEIMLDGRIDLDRLAAALSAAAQKTVLDFARKKQGYGDYDVRALADDIESGAHLK